MRLAALESKSILILGFGTEGQATYEFLRKKWPAKPLWIADQRKIDEFPAEAAGLIRKDSEVRLLSGPQYLDSILENSCEVIIKTPGIPGTLGKLSELRQAGRTITSHLQIFLSNYPREKVIGVTGTKGKSTTASLIHHILEHAGIPAELAGNIGRPPLPLMDDAAEGAWFVIEFSSHQLADVNISPHIAVLLNIVPEHLDYYASFEEYAAAKENITKFQTPDDFLVYAADYPVPSAIAARSRAGLRPVSAADAIEDFVGPSEIPIRGKFNLLNVGAAIAAASLCGAGATAVRDAVRSFRPLPHRLQLVGTYKQITFYDDSIATIPAAALGAIEALGADVETVILGGHERHLDFTTLGEQLPGHIKTVILFPPTGTRIWEAIERHSRHAALPDAFFVRDMEQAVKIAYEHTAPGKICLLSPASPSFGTFKDYRERGDLFQAFVRKLSSS